MIQETSADCLTLDKIFERRVPQDEQKYFKKLKLEENVLFCFFCLVSFTAYVI
jgi:hypothetical protein